MPNYVKLEQELLSASDLKLARTSRRPAVEELTADELQQLILDLETARDAAGDAGSEGQLSNADLLGAALRRAHQERRNRGMKTARQVAIPAASGPAAPAAAKKRAPRETVSGRRKPAGRKTADTRKADLRTGSRRVVKAPAKPAIAEAEAVRQATPDIPAETARATAPDTTPEASEKPARKGKKSDGKKKPKSKDKPEKSKPKTEKKSKKDKGKKKKKK